MSLTNRLKAHIGARGPLTVAEFMERALYDPRDGYYHQKIPIGRKGDYITAPEMTRYLAKQLPCGSWIVGKKRVARPPFIW